MRPRDNPYRTDCVLSVRHLLQAGSLPQILQALAAHGGRGAIVGPEGSGKTTLLEDLAPHLEMQGYQVHYLRLNRQDRHPNRTFWKQALGPKNALLVDGAEVLYVPQWLRLRWHTRNCGVMLLTAHREGLLPTVQHTSTSPQLLQEICARLGQKVSLDHCQQLCAHHQGNLRLALRELYDECGAPRPSAK